MSVEKGNVEKHQEILQNGKKLIWIAEKEKGGWEVVKCYLLHNLASDLENEKQLLRAPRKVASHKKKWESANKKERKRDSVSECSPTTIENPSNWSVDHGRHQ